MSSRKMAAGRGGIGRRAISSSKEYVASAVVRLVASSAILMTLKMSAHVHNPRRITRDERRVVVGRLQQPRCWSWGRTIAKSLKLVAVSWQPVLRTI